MPRVAPNAGPAGNGSVEEKAARSWLPRAVTLADQVTSSVSNVLVIPLVAPLVSAADLGRFVLGYTILMMTLTLCRAYFGTRVTLSPDNASALAMMSNVLGALALLAPVLVIAVLAVSAAATAGESLHLLILVALAAPIVCMQDILRFGAVASGRPLVALGSDAVWVAFMAAPLALQMSLSPVVAVSLWAGGAVAALVVAWAAMRVRPRLQGGIGELRRRDAVAGSITLGHIGWSGASLWILVFVTHVIGPAATGSLAVASRAMGPINVLFNYITLGVTPLLVRRDRSSDVRFCAGTAGVMSSLILLWGALLLVLPTSVGTALLGDSWPGVRGVLPWTIAEYVFLAIATAAGLGLQVRRRARALIRQRAVATVIIVVGGSVVAVLVHETWAVAATVAAAIFTAAVLGWGALLRSDPPASSRQPVPSARLLPLEEA